MGSSLSSQLVAVTGAVLATANTLACSSVLFTVAILKLVVPAKSWRGFASRLLASIAEVWISVNNALISLLLPTSWTVEGADGLSPSRSYLVVCNHQSWVDILVLQKTFNRKIPFLRFFLKRELIWVPILGLAWWALDFPFVRRYSREFLRSHPHLRGKDLEITRKACERFRGNPVAIMNFVEGTRFTAAKHARQKSPYRHLLRPKTGGIGFALGSMGEQLDGLLDVTIVYPDGVPRLWDFMSRRVPQIHVHVRRRQIPHGFSDTAQQGDEQTRDRLRQWIEAQWAEKDARITSGISGATAGRALSQVGRVSPRSLAAGTPRDSRVQHPVGPTGSSP